MLCFLSLFSWGHAAYSEHAIAYGVSLLLSRTCMVSVGNLDESKIFRVFEKLAEKYALVVMNYLGICLEYLRSAECKFSPLGVLSGALTLPFLFSFFVLLMHLPM